MKAIFKTRKNRIIWLFSVLILFVNCKGQQPDSTLFADSYIKVTSQLYMIPGFGGNVSFLATDDGVLVVDAGSTPGDAKKIQEIIHSITDKPIKYLVLTHYHYDHANGACGFDKGVIIIGHDNIYENLQKFGEEYLKNLRESLSDTVNKLEVIKDSVSDETSTAWIKADSLYQVSDTQLKEAKKTKIVYPDITFKKDLNIFLGSDTIKLVYPGKTHTNCEILVYFINQKVVATGDFLFTHALPYIDYRAHSDTKNWIDDLKKLSEKDYNTFIPGHGKVGTKQDVLNEEAYLTDLRAAVKACIEKGQSLSQAQKSIKLTKYAGYDYQFMIPGNIEAVYKEISKKMGEKADTDHKTKKKK